MSMKKKKTCRHLQASFKESNLRKTLKGAFQTATFLPASNTSLLTCAAKECARESAHAHSTDRVATWICLFCGQSFCEAHIRRHGTQNAKHFCTFHVSSEVIWCNVCGCNVVDATTESASNFDKLRQVARGIYKDMQGKAPRMPKPLQNQNMRLERTLASLKSKSEGRRLGLRNLGNTCYLNSIVQSLVDVKPLLGNLHEMNERGSLGNIGQAFWRLANAFKNASTKPRKNHQPTVLSTLELLQSIQGKHPQFQGHSQQDAHELFLHLVDSFEEKEGAHQPNEEKPKTGAPNLKNVNDEKELTNPSEETFPIHIETGLARFTLQVRSSTSMDTIRAMISDRLKLSKNDFYVQQSLTSLQSGIPRQTCNSSGKNVFQGEGKYVVTCQECYQESIHVDMFTSLSLSIPASTRSGEQSVTIYDCLNMFTRPQEISTASGNGYACSNCPVGQRSSALAKFEVTKWPEVLVLHLNRLRLHGNKVTQQVAMPHELVLLHAAYQYNLQSLVIHQGGSTGGHYTCCVLSESSEKGALDWWFTSDEKVQRISADQLDSKQVYMAVYVRK